MCYKGAFFMSSNLQEIISQDFKEAMRSQNEVAKSALRMLRAEIIKKEIELKKKDEGLSDSEIQQIVLQDIKKRQDAIEAFKKGGRDDLVLKEEEELDVVEKYRPQLLSEEELRGIIAAAIAKTQAKAPKDTGIVMKEVMSRVQGKAEGNRVRAIVEEALS